MHRPSAGREVTGMPLFKYFLNVARDIYGLGAINAVKALFATNGSGTLRLQIPRFGPVTIRRGDSDLNVVRQVFMDQEYSILYGDMSRRLESRYEAILSSGDIPIVIDAGANIGASSLWFGTLYPKALVCAIEPDQANARLLRRNVESKGNIRVFEAAIGATEGFAAVKKGQDQASWAMQTERSEGGCPIITINQLISAVPRGIPFITKVDIEGFEADLFSTNLEWLDNTFAVLIEPHDWMLPGRQTSRTFQRAMATQEFEILIRGENLIYVRT